MEKISKFQRRVKKLEELMRNAYTKLTIVHSKAELDEWQINALAQFCGEIAFGYTELIGDEQDAVDSIANQYIHNLKDAATRYNQLLATDLKEDSK